MLIKELQSLKDLPKEIQTKIYAYLTPKQIKVLQRLNREFSRKIIEDQFLWQLKFHEYFPRKFAEEKSDPMLDKNFAGKISPTHWHDEFLEVYAGGRGPWFSMAGEGRLACLLDQPTILTPAEFRNLFCYQDQSKKSVLDYILDYMIDHGRVSEHGEIFCFKTISAENKVSNHWYRLNYDKRKFTPFLRDNSYDFRFVSIQELDKIIVRTSAALVVCVPLREQPLTNIERAKDIAQIYQHSITLLHSAIKTSNFYLAQIVLELGARSNNFPDSLFSSLQFAILNGSDADLFKELLRIKGIGNVSKEALGSLLVLAIQYHCKAIVRVLLEPPCSVDVNTLIDDQSLLSYAVKCGDDVSFKTLISYGAKLSEEEFGTLFAIAVRSCCEEIVRVLLEPPCSVDVNTLVKGRSALSYAIERGDGILFGTLVEYGATLSLADLVYFRHLETAELTFSSELKHFKVIQKTVKIFFDDFVKELSPGYVFKSKYGETLFHLAAHCGSADSVSTLIQLGYDINELSGKRETPLHIAIQRGNPEIVKLLLENGAMVNRKPIEGGELPLERAIHYFKKDVIGLLLVHPELALDACNGEGLNPFQITIQFSKLEPLKYLLNHICQHDKLLPICENGDTLLHYAFRLYALRFSLSDEVEVAVFRLLFETNQIDINSTNENGDTPLHVFIRAYEGGYNKGQIEVAKIVLQFLLGARANINAFNPYTGETVLYLAVSLSSIELVKALLERGADPNISTDPSKIPLFAIPKGWKGMDMAILLCEARADVTAIDPLGRSTLQLILLSVDYFTIDGSTPDDFEHTSNLNGFLNQLDRFLVEFFLPRCNINHCDNNGETALCIALRGGNVDIISQLLSKGATVIYDAKNRPEDYEKLEELLMVALFIQKVDSEIDLTDETSVTNISSFFNSLFHNAYDNYSKECAAKYLFQSLSKDEDIRGIPNTYPAIEKGELGQIYRMLIEKRYSPPPLSSPPDKLITAIRGLFK